MRYLIALLLPPLAILLCGKPVEAVVALVLQLTVLGWIPATIWAFVIIAEANADGRTNRLIDAQNKARRDD